MRLLFSLLLLAAAVYAALVLALYLRQAKLVYYPDVGRDVTTTPRSSGLEYEEVWLTPADGKRVHGWYLPHAGALGVVLVLHGNSGSIASRLEWLRILHRMSYASCIIDYRGFGRSDGTPSEANTYEDARLAWSHLVEVRGWPARDVVLMGESLGGPMAADLAARETPRALVLQSTFTSLIDVAARVYPWMPVRRISRFRYETRRSLENVRAPVLIAHSREDELIPFSHALALYAAARAPKAFIELSGGHDHAAMFNRPEWVAQLAGFIARR